MTQSKTVFLTGVSSGIGHGLADEYLQRGWKVFGVSRRKPDALLKREEFCFQALDLADSTAVALKLQSLFEGIEKLDLAILNAGILGRIADMPDVSIEELKHTMNVNVWANKSVLDVLLNGSFPVSQVVTISSGAAVNGNRGWNGYAISKAALNMLTQLYAVEHPSTHFAAVAPGLVDTAMQEVLCSLVDQVTQFPSLGVLQSKRGGPEMPSPDKLAPRLADFVQQLPSQIESGNFVDIRTPLSKNN
jgi:NAD(P)-dependent dehydrogenase (short-subunit alcohol dehydrogenase family)